MNPFYSVYSLQSLSRPLIKNNSLGYLYDAVHSLFGFAVQVSKKNAILMLQSVKGPKSGSEYSNFFHVYKIHTIHYNCQ